ncbi:hypothetical protein HY772_09300, partial [Candidatus Woesearchaeota archaeon]|nr:hypothetical protein [Candidatus Woesearchaeota archaeon]
LAGGLLFWFKSRFDAVKKVSALVGVVLVLIGIQTLSPNAYVDILNTIIWTTAAVTAVLILFIGFKDYLYPMLNRVKVRARVEEPRKTENTNPTDDVK